MERPNRYSKGKAARAKKAAIIQRRAVRLSSLMRARRNGGRRKGG